MRGALGDIVKIALALVLAKIMIAVIAVVLLGVL